MKHLWLVARLECNVTGDGNGQSIGGRFGDGTLVWVNESDTPPFYPLGLFTSAGAALALCERVEDFVIEVRPDESINARLWRHGHYPQTANNLPPIEFLELDPLTLRRGHLNRVVNNTHPDHAIRFMERYRTPAPA